MSIPRHFLLLFVLSIPGLAIGQNTTDSCNSLNSYNEIIKCALQVHPDSIRSQLQMKQNENLTDVARQMPNPEVNGQVLWGKDQDKNKTQYTQVNLAHTFELGGKRDARIKKAEAEVDESRIEFQKSQEEVYLKTYFALLRLRQIRDELSAYDDALTTFDRIQRQYRSRPRMTPEQKATYSMMDIAANDYRMRRQALVSESRSQEKFLEIAVGKKLSITDGQLPQRRTTWPTLRNTDDISQSLTLKKSLSELKAAEFDLEGAKSLAWPDLKLGPTFERQTQGPDDMNQFGVNVALTLPLYHQNGAGKSYAQAGVLRAKSSLDAAKTSELNDLQLNLQSYQDAVEALTRSLSPIDLKKKHKEIEQAFSNGVLPSSLILEIHRQLIDYTKSSNDQEATALQALAKIYSIEGRLLSETL